MTLKDGKKLDNILSVSTAAQNKYLFHFDSYHALSQWTAGIRLAMFEHTSLSESYTGALIAGKGKTLNNIRAILDRQCAIYDDWVRVRFGAGSPWRRCWCVVSPPDQKEYAKLQKSAKKAGPYDRPAVLKGDIKFYDTNKIKKKTKPIATIKDAYSCFAIYPQSKQLIDQSTLVKIEGKVTIHANPDKTTEAFVFVMPETRPAVLGFEIMLQYLFPVFDTFNLYGRPKKLVADVLDTRGLMFGMPPDRHYGYLEIWDVVTLINTDGSQTWSERQWRKQLKDLTSARISASMGADDDAGPPRAGRRNTVSRGAFTPSRSSLRFSDQGSVRSNPSTRRSSPTRQARVELEPQDPLRRIGTSPPAAPFVSTRHQRSVSEQNGYSHAYQSTPSRLAHGQMAEDLPPAPPAHGEFNGAPQHERSQYPETSDSDDGSGHEPRNLPDLPADVTAPPTGYVESPPPQQHAHFQQPPVRPALPSGMRPNASVDPATYQQMADATNVPRGGVPVAGAAAAWKSQESIHSRRSGEYNGYGENGGHQMHLNAYSRPSPTHSGSEHRLPTIPASPYVEHDEFVQQSHAFQPMAPPVPEHAEAPQEQWSQTLPHRPHSDSSGSGQVQRKPVPGPFPPASKEDDTRSITSSSLGSLRNQVIDPAALDALVNNESPIHRQQSQSSSRYDDDAISTSTPDYASVASEEPEPRQRLPVRDYDRPRSGILKIAGDPNLKDAPDPVPGSARVDEGIMGKNMFGHTFDVSRELGVKRPGTSGTMTQDMHDGNFSKSSENLAYTPNEQRRQSYFGRNSPSPNAALQHSPQNSESRSVPWHPNMSAPQQQASRQTLDPDAWVKHRASQSQPLAYGHGRSSSRTPPPFGRQRSGDYTQMLRNPGDSPMAGQPTSRPVSRGAGAILDQRPTSLTAREQQQIAQMTGTPLIDLAEANRQKKRQVSQPNTLTGYIDTREKEKAAHKSRFSNTTAMQAEIDRRLQQNQQRQIQEAEYRQRRMLEQQQQQMQAAMAHNYQHGEFPQYAAPSGAPSVMGMSMGTPSVMGMPLASPGMGTPSPGIGMAYTSPQQMIPQNYFQQPVMTPNTNLMPGGFPQASPQGQYFQQQQQQSQQQRPTQAYGASFDQAQARQAQQGGHRR
jgi:CCR4-NOT transcriptional complex subunit CAF120